MSVLALVDLNGGGMLVPVRRETGGATEHHNTIGLRTLRSLLVLAALGSGACSGPPERVPFTYERVIASSISARGLSRCVEAWSPWAATRTRLFGEMQRHGVWRAREVVVLEAGGATWAGYRYALAVDGKALSGPREAGQDMGVVLGDVSVGPTQGVTSESDPNADDGGCWFLTVVRDERATQVAVYGLIEEAGGEAAQIVKRMLPYVQSPEPQ